MTDVDNAVEYGDVAQFGPARIRRQPRPCRDGPGAGVGLDAHEPGRDRSDERKGHLGIFAAFLGRVGERQDLGVSSLVLAVAVKDLRQVGLNLDPFRLPGQDLPDHGLAVGAGGEEAEIEGEYAAPELVFEAETAVDEGEVGV